MADVRWSEVPPAWASSTQGDWLGRPGSLTRRLAALGAFRLAVDREGAGAPWSDDLDVLRARPDGLFWIREVVLLVDEVPCVFAHTVVALADSEGAWCSVRSLGDRPLAELLYQDAGVSRSAFTSAEIGPSHPMAARARAAASEARGAPGGRYLARRSVFRRLSRPLLVIECMLPGLWRRVDISA